MSIYATLWKLQFPRYGDLLADQGWIEVMAQGVPAHVGSPTPGCGYEGGDPYADFLPPAVACEVDEPGLRAVVFVTPETRKGTPRSGQEYDHPLLVITGEEYERSTFAELHERICGALRGNRPRAIMRVLGPDGSIRVVYDDGSDQMLPPPAELSRLA